MTPPIPTDESVSTASLLPASQKKQTISLAMAERAAKEAGFDIIDAKQLKASGIFGEFITQVGAIHLGRARLAVNIARADKAMEFCERAADSAGDSETMIGLMKIQADLIGKSNNAAELLIKSAQQAAETAKTEALTQLPGFAPRAQVGLTQVNVSVTAPKLETAVTEVKGDDDASN